MNLNRIWSLYRSDLKAQFTSPVLYIFLIAFWLLHGFFAFRLSQFFAANHAAMDAAITWHPWLWLILVPAVGMHLWADERRDGTIELLFTLPMTLTESVLAKYVAALSVLVLALIGTFPYVVTLFYLGSPEVGLLATSYLGSFLFAAAALAVTSVMSALTRSHVVGFILALATLLFLTLIGWDTTLTFLRELECAPFIIDAAGAISMLWHFYDFQRGLVESSNIVYYLSMIVLFLALTQFVLDCRNSRLKRWGKIFLSIAVCFAVNIIAGFFPIQGDFTEAQSFTLSESAQKILKNIPEDSPVVLTLYFSETHRDISPRLKTFAARVWLFMQKVARMNPNITVRKVNPIPDTEAEDMARAAGIQGTPLISGEHVYFGIGLKSLDRLATLPAILPNQESELEYHLVSAIVQVTRSEKPEIGIISDVPLIKIPMPGEPDPSWLVFKELQKNYKVSFLKKLSLIQNADPARMPVIIVFHPTQLSSEQKWAIDQYLLRGGKLMVATDILPLSIPSERENQPSSPSSFEPFMGHWGITVSQNPVCDPEANPQDPSTGMVYPANLQLREKSISRTLSLSSNLRNMMMIGCAGMRFTQPKDATFTMEPLLFSSDTAFEFFAHYALQQNRPIPTAIIPKKNQGRSEFAMLLSGSFTTAFPDSAKLPNALSVSQKPSSVLLVSDIDFLCNPAVVRAQQTPFGQTLTPLNDNLFFFLNCIELLSGDQALASIRVKPVEQRPLQRIVDMQKAAAAQRQTQILQYENKLKAVSSEIAKLQSSQNGKIILTPEAQSKLKSLQQNRKQVNDELKKQRRAFRADVEQLQSRIEILNLLLLPLLVGLFALVYLIIRSRKCGAQ